jgi:hypothetical protein
MCSYNAVNGVPSCADDYLLQTVLREYWEWTKEDQWVTSDCDAVNNIYNASSWNVPKYGHNYTSTPEQAAADALNAGTGMYIPELLSLITVSHKIFYNQSPVLFQMFHDSSNIQISYLSNTNSEIA